MDRLTSHARKALTISIGIVLLIVGVALLILPGPGIPLILVGLTLLGAHFAWARKLRARAVDLGKQGLGWGKRLRSSLFRPRATANGGAGSAGDGRRPKAAAVGDPPP